MMSDNDADDFNAMLSSLSPEELQQLLGLGTLDERGALLSNQMAQADALMQPQGRQYSTGLGAALGGIGDLTRQIAGTRQQEALLKQQEALLGKKDAGRGLYTEALRRRMGQPQMQPTENVIPAVPFGM